MKCPVCGTSLPPLTDRCPDCGYRCRTAPASQPQSAPAAAAPAGTGVPYTPPNKTRGCKGCCCALVIVIPVVLILALLVYAAFDHTSTNYYADEFTGGFGEYFEEFPFEEMTPESMPAAADDGCFAVADRTLMFLRDNWDGSPVLRIPDTVGGVEIRSIGVGCFADCTELTTIVLPETVTAISPMAFSGCTELRGLYLPDGVEFVGKDAFAGCRSLEAIYVPASVTSIPSGCFDDCASLRYIFYGGTYEDWNALYPDYINPFTIAICLDGDYYHGAEG